MRDELSRILSKAKKGPHMIAVFTAEGERINLYLKTEKYPVLEFENSLELLTRELEKLARPNQKRKTPPR